MSWSKPMATPLPPMAFIMSTNIGLPMVRIFRPCRSSIFVDRLLAVVDAAGAGIHPGEADQAGGRMVGDLLQELVADLAVDDVVHLVDVAEDVGQVEDVELGDDRAHDADRDARHGERRRPAPCSSVSFSPPSCMEG